MNRSRLLCAMRVHGGSISCKSCHVCIGRKNHKQQPLHNGMLLVWVAGFFQGSPQTWPWLTYSFPAASSPPKTFLAVQ